MKVRNRTAQIKPATRHAILDQLALAADEIIRLRTPDPVFQGVTFYEDIEGERLRRILAPTFRERVSDWFAGWRA